MRYRLHNLSIESNICLDLLIADKTGTDADLVIFRGPVEFDLANPSYEGSWYQLNKNIFIIEIAGIARFKIAEGKEITVHSFPDVSDTEISLYLLGSVITAALIQRNIFLLHASAVANEHGALLISGNSGVGKSTICAGLIKNGYHLVADDVCLLIPGNGQTWVYPTHPHLKLWRDSLDAIDEFNADLTRVGKNIDKYYWPVGERFTTKAQPVNALCEITLEKETLPIAAPLQGADKLMCVIRNTYRGDYSRWISERGNDILYWNEIALNFSIYRVNRSEQTGVKQMINHFDQLSK